MYVGDRDTSDDVFCQDCGRIADREFLDENGLCEDCASPVANIVESTEATHQWLETIIPWRPRRAEFTLLSTAKMPDRIYDALMDRLEELKEQGIVGYWKREKSIAIVLHSRR